MAKKRAAKRAPKKKTAKKAPKRKAAKKAPKRKAAKKAPKRKAAKRATKKARASAPRVAPRVARRSAPNNPAGPRVHPVVHWEIQSQKPEVLHGFYREAFGWDVNANNPMNYGMVASAGKGGINGGIGGSPGGGSRVTVYAAVPSIESALEKIASLGGQIIMPRTDIGPVIMGLYHDPEGNLMGLIEG
jgi:predicted enzyme related to lactoylglutathione lyase